MDERIIQGICLEYYRNKNNKSIQEIIGSNYKICDYKTYKKIMQGEIVSNRIYEDLFNFNNISFKMDACLNEQIENIAYRIKSHLSFLNLDCIKKDIEDVLFVLMNQNVFPYEIYYDFIHMLYRFHFYREDLNAQLLKNIKNSLWLFDDNIKICFYYLNYIYVYKTTLEEKEITKFVNEIPESFHYDENIMRILMDSYRYRFDINKSLYYADLLEKKCQETNNDNMILFAYKNKHAIFKYQKEYKKKEYYFNLLIKEAKYNLTLSDDIKEQLFYYIGMNAFEEHDFKDSYFMFSYLLNKDYKDNYNLIIPFLHIIDNKDLTCEVSKWIQYLYEKKGKYKLLGQYYSMKFNGTKKESLIKYILEKVIPILNENNVFDYHIFLEELYWLDKLIYKKVFNIEYNSKFKINEYWLPSFNL